MPKGIGLSLAAGLGSAVVFLVAVRLQGPLAPLLYLVALPVVTLGLTRGLAAALTASLVALAAAGAVSAGSLPVFIALAVAPALLLVRQGLMCRLTGRDRLEWCPPGLLLGWVTAAAVALLLLAAGFFAVHGVGLKDLVTRHVAEFASQVASQMGEEIPAPLRDQLTSVWAAFLPAMMGCLWLLMVVGNGLLGQWLALRSGHAIRPWPRLRPLDLPGWIAPAFAASLAVGLVASGDPGYIGRNVAALLLVPYLLAGLAEVHAMVEGRSRARLLLTVFYVGFVFFSGWSLLAVAGFGLVRHWTRLHRQGAGGGQEEK